MKDKLISNRQVIKAILDNKELFKFPEDIQRFAVIIEDLPPMNELQGEWIDKGEYAECSICGIHSGTQFDGVEPIPLMTNFCPNCGVYMKRTDDEKKSADKWIPCSKRLPKKEGHYLCSFKKAKFIDNIYIDLAYWTGGRWYGYLANEINAWMPLPEPWEGASDERHNI